ncbi:MAG: hypothetical protein ACRDAM_12320 [Casimicrobium sp.]
MNGRKKPPKTDDEAQSKRFIEIAKAIAAPDADSRFDSAMSVIVSKQPEHNLTDAEKKKTGPK